LTRTRQPVTGSHGPRYGWPRLLPYTPPWIAWLALPALATAARLYWATSVTSAMLAMAGIVITAGSLTAFTWHVFRARGRSIRAHATLSVGVASGWLIVALAAGLSSRAVWSVWLLAGFGVCLAWSLRRIARGEGHDRHDDDTASLTAAVGLVGARIGKPKVIGAKVSAPLQLVGGEQVTKDAQGAKARFASKLGLRPGAVRVIGNPGNEALPTLEIVPADQLTAVRPWAGPTAPGASIADAPIEFGTAEDSERMWLWLSGDHKLARPAAHYGIAGMTGSGKTETGLVICADVITRVDASLIYVDSVKGIQSIAPIAAGVDLPIIEKASARAFMKLLPALISKRTEWLGQHGFKQWEPGCGLHYLVIQIEEAAALIAESTTFVKAIEQARSAGISLLVSLQRMSHDRIDTSARENLGGGLCFGVRNEDSAAMVLSDETLDAGAQPWLWKNAKPGYLYLEGPGIDAARWSIPGRGDLADPAHLAAVVAEWGHPGLDHVTAIALGDLYAQHVALVADGHAPGQTPPLTATRMPAVVVPSDDVDDRDDGPDEAYDDDTPAQPEPGFMDDIDPAVEIPEDDDSIVALALPMSRPGRTEAVGALRGELAAMVAAGKAEVSVAELVELRQRIGRSASWLSGELARLVEEDYLADHPDRGVYGLPTLVPA
jgi:hypothetical protein